MMHMARFHGRPWIGCSPIQQSTQNMDQSHRYFGNMRVSLKFSSLNFVPLNEDYSHVEKKLAEFG